MKMLFMNKFCWSRRAIPSIFLQCLTSVNNQVYERPTSINQIICWGRHRLGFSNLHNACVYIGYRAPGQSMSLLFCPRFLAFVYVHSIGLAFCDAPYFSSLISSASTRSVGKNSTPTHPVLCICFWPVSVL